MKNPRLYSRLEWANEQKGKLLAVEKKYRDQMGPADAQGLKVDMEEMKRAKREEIKSILAAAQYKNYLEEQGKMEH